MNPVTPIPTKNAKQTSTFLPDYFPAILSNFDLDLNSRVLIFNFLESICEQGITSASFSLTDSQPLPSNITSQVMINSIVPQMT